MDIAAVPQSRSANTPGEIPVVGTYRNSEYAYVVEIPPALHAYRLGAPAPNHGFGINVPGKSNSYIWVDGKYDATMLGSLDGAVENEESSFAELYQLRVVDAATRQLGGAVARDVTMVAKEDAATGAAYLRFVLAYRPSTTGGVGIVTVVALRQAVRDATVDADFEAVLQSTGLLPMPG